jgi:hypothetical protein
VGKIGKIDQKWTFWIFFQKSHFWIIILKNCLRCVPRLEKLENSQKRCENRLILANFSHNLWSKNHVLKKVGRGKVAVVRESHKLFLSLTGEFAWKVWAVHKWKRENFHSNFPVRLKKILWEARSTPTLKTLKIPWGTPYSWATNCMPHGIFRVFKPYFIQKLVSKSSNFPTEHSTFALYLSSHRSLSHREHVAWCPNCKSRVAKPRVICNLGIISVENPLPPIQLCRSIITVSFSSEPIFPSKFWKFWKYLFTYRGE